MAVLIGAILGLSLLALDSELIVMRSSGVSIGQITSAVLKLGLLLAFIALLIGEFLTPWTETLAQRGRAQALEQNIEHMRQGLKDNFTQPKIVREGVIPTIEAQVYEDATDSVFFKPFKAFPNSIDPNVQKELKC